MGLKLIEASEIERYEKDLKKQFFKTFNKTKTIDYNDYAGDKSSFPVNYNNSNTWFHYQDNLSSVEYSLGDLNHPTHYKNINRKTNSIKPYIVIRINNSVINKSNCRFAYDEKTNETFLLLETLSSNKFIRNLKEIGFKFITINSNKNHYLKIKFDKVADYMTILIRNIEFSPVYQPLKIKKINQLMNLEEDFHKINNFNSNLGTKDNILNNKSKEYNFDSDLGTKDNILNDKSKGYNFDSDLGTKDNILNNKSKEYNNMLNSIECSVCHEILHYNDFRKILGGYSHVCKNCEDKVLAANYINIILEYLEPGETFDMEKLIKEHPTQDLTDLIFTLQENNLIKKDFQSNFYLESEDVLNDFKKKYLKDSSKFNKKSIKSSMDLEHKPIKGKVVEYDEKHEVWYAYVIVNNEKSILGLFDTEEEAYQAYLNGKVVEYDEIHEVWYAYVIVNNEKSILGLFDTEEEAYQAHLKYIEDKKVKIETTDSGINKEIEVLDNIECKVCHEILPKNDFKNILGEYGHVCKRCGDKVLAAKYINIILEYLEPGETFNMDEFIQEHHHQDLSDIIFTLQENDLIKRDFGFNYYLESEDVLNDFKEKYLNISN